MLLIITIIMITLMVIIILGILLTSNETIISTFVRQLRCVCPGKAQGPSCKVLARTFSGSGWAWVRPLVNCLPTTISFRVLTRRPDALLLYSGPLATLPRSADTPPAPLLAVQLWQGRPQVLLEDGGRPQKLEVNTTVHDGRWHTVHIYLEFHVS